MHDLFILFSEFGLESTKNTAIDINNAVNDDDDSGGGYNVMQRKYVQNFVMFIRTHKSTHESKHFQNLTANGEDDRNGNAGHKLCNKSTASFINLDKCISTLKWFDGDFAKTFL